MENQHRLDLAKLFGVQDQVIVVVGGSGVLGSEMSRGLALAGARVAILGQNAGKAEARATAIRQEGGEAVGIGCNVMERTEVERALEQVESRLGKTDTLINGAGGNQPQATTSAERSFFELDLPAMQTVLGLNLLGTVQCCQVFGRGMAERGQGCIVNIGSMSGLRPLTRIPAYSAAKAAVSNFTQWLAVHMAQEYSPRIRVNAIAPGFFITEQNRFLMTDAQTGGMTPRGQTILDHTPAGRLGEPADLLGTLFWLVSPASTFVTGVVVPVDGGFASFGGV